MNQVRTFELQCHRNSWRTTRAQTADWRKESLANTDVFHFRVTCTLCGQTHDGSQSLQR
jgi:hypothetical protein